MRILMSTVGTRGDVQPVLALALQLQELGHEVRLCVPPNFVEQAEGLGFEARRLGIEMRAPRRGEAPVAIPDLISDQFEVIVAAAKGCDLLVGGGAHQYAARSAAELYEIPCVVAVYSPTAIPSRLLPPGGPSDFPGDFFENERLWNEAKSAWNSRALERVNSNRRRWQLNPVEDVLGHILSGNVWLAADAAMAPAPSSAEGEVFQSGAWFMKDERPLPAELSAFLADGDPPIYVGFGSMPAPQTAVNIVIDVARTLGRRLIVSRGWAEWVSTEPDSRCLVIDEVNQQALFPLVAAVVHHGGAGTTTIAARAGVPQVVTPMFSDQFYWGYRIRELEIGAIAPMSSLSFESLEPALHHALEAEVVSRAHVFARRISSDGTMLAAERLLSLID